MKSKKEEGNDAFRSGRLQEAYDIYTEALSIDDQNDATNSKLYNNRGTVCSKVRSQLPPGDCDWVTSELLYCG